MLDKVTNRVITDYLIRISVSAEAGNSLKMSDMIVTETRND